MPENGLYSVSCFAIWIMMSLTCIPDTWRLYISISCQVLHITASAHIRKTRTWAISRSSLLSFWWSFLVVTSLLNYSRTAISRRRLGVRDRFSIWSHITSVSQRDMFPVKAGSSGRLVPGVPLPLYCWAPSFIYCAESVSLPICRKWQIIVAYFFIFIFWISFIYFQLVGLLSITAEVRKL